MVRAIRRFALGTLAVAVAVSLGSGAGAQSSGTRVGTLAGVHYGAPLKWSVPLAITLNERGALLYRFVALEPGVGGWRASAGQFRFISNLGSGRASRLSVLHTNKRAWHAPPNTTYVGPEFQYMPAFMMGLRVGGFFRVGGEGTPRTLFTADVSLLL